MIQVYFELLTSTNINKCYLFWFLNTFEKEIE
jgi:hypothetical protein